MEFPKIAALRTFLIDEKGCGGDYHNVDTGHWLIDSPIATPMSRWKEYKGSRTSWGVNVLGSLFVEIEATDGTVGFATGFGGVPACWLAHNHFERFLIGADPRDTNNLFELMYRGSMFYGRKGLVLAVISAIDLALWDLLGKVRKEAVYKMIGGAVKDRLDFYCTGPQPAAMKALGFIGGKIALPYGPADGQRGLERNLAFIREHRQQVGPDFPLRVDCYMSLDISYTIELVKASEKEQLNVDWWEECLPPDDFDGYATLKRAHPTVKFTHGEHEYSRYGMRKLIEDGRNVDILQPDVTWVGGLTELLKISALAAAYDIPVVPHASGPYSYHFAFSQVNCPFQEYVAASADGRSILPVFGSLFLNEPMPHDGHLLVSSLDKPGFGLELNPAANLVSADRLFRPLPQRALEPPAPDGEQDAEINRNKKLVN
ncbi:enolase C-terminal domain-like protein [Aspergillus heterothallicus]